MTFKNEMDMNNWIDVFSSCLGQMRTIQEASAEILRTNWSLDLSRGIIRFGTKEYAVQVIGNEVQSDKMWKWEWNNIDHLDEHVLLLARSVKERGIQLGLEPLCTSDIPLTEKWNGHNFGIVSCGIWEENMAYFRCPYDGGAVFVAIMGIDIKVLESINSIRFSQITMECLQNYEINHPIFIESFLQWNETPYEWMNELELRAHFEQDMHIWFERVDNVVRVRQIKGELA